MTVLRSRWFGFCKQIVMVTAFLAVGLFVAGKLVAFIGSDAATPFAVALGQAKQALFFPLLVMRWLIYGGVILAAPNVFNHLRRSTVSTLDRKIIRWAIFRIVVVYELLFGLNIFQWI